MAQTLHTGTETSGGSGAGQPTNSPNNIALFITVSAISGITVALVVRLQDSIDGINWVDLPNMASISIGSPLTARIGSTLGTKVSEYVRVAWTLIGVVPSATFTADLSYE